MESISSSQQIAQQSQILQEDHARGLVLAGERCREKGEMQQAISAFQKALDGAEGDSNLLAKSLHNLLSTLCLENRNLEVASYQNLVLRVLQDPLNSYENHFSLCKFVCQALPAEQQLSFLERVISLTERAPEEFLSDLYYLYVQIALPRKQELFASLSIEETAQQIRRLWKALTHVQDAKRRFLLLADSYTLCSRNVHPSHANQQLWLLLRMHELLSTQDIHFSIGIETRDSLLSRVKKLLPFDVEKTT